MTDDAAATRRGSSRVAEFEPLARAAMDPAAYDYVAGGAWDELTLAENEAAWRRRRFRPRVLVDVSRGRPLDDDARDARSRMPGRDRADGRPGARPSRRRAGDGPRRRGGRRPVHPVDDVVALDRGGRRGRARRDPLVPALRPGATRASSRSLVERAAAAGYGAIVLTVDLPVLGYRERDRRSGLRAARRSATSRDAAATHGEPTRDRSLAGVDDRSTTA